jgi:hypothetical protein
VREARLHDARHTTTTVLLVLGMLEHTVMDIMGWSSTAMAARYQHVTDPIRREVAARVGAFCGRRGTTNDTKGSTRRVGQEADAAYAGVFGLVRSEAAGFEPVRGLSPQPA